jgi:hypothetical protein
VVAAIFDAVKKLDTGQELVAALSQRCSGRSDGDTSANTSALVEPSVLLIEEMAQSIRKALLLPNSLGRGPRRQT